MSYYPLPNQAGDAQGRNNYITRQLARRRFLLDELPGRSRPDEQAALLRPLLAEQPRGEPRQLDGRDRRHQADRQLPVPHQRRAQRRSRLDDVELVAAERAGELVALPGAEHPPAPGDLRSGDASGSRNSATQYFGSNLYFPRFEMDDAASFSDLGDSFSGGTNVNIYSRPADLDAVPRQAQLPLGRRFPRLPRRELPQRALRRALRLTPAPARRLDQAARQFAGGGDRPGPRGDAARVSERRHDRPQRRSLQSGDLRRRVLPGRLEGQLGADRQPGSALGV